MSSSLLIILVFLDILLLGVVYYLGKKRINPLEIVRELNEERRLLSEMRKNLKEEMSFERKKAKEILDRIMTIGTDIELEVKNSGSIISSEVESVLPTLEEKIEVPLKQLNKKIAVLDKLYQKIKKERKMLNYSLERGEQLTKFFSDKVPYEKVLSEIEDKKYSDARGLLAQGVSPSQVAMELGLAESEVTLLASIG